MSKRIPKKKDFSWFLLKIAIFVARKNKVKFALKEL